LGQNKQIFLLLHILYTVSEFMFDYAYMHEQSRESYIQRNCIFKNATAVHLNIS